MTDDRKDYEMVVNQPKSSVCYVHCCIRILVEGIHQHYVTFLVISSKLSSYRMQVRKLYVSMTFSENSPIGDLRTGLMLN